MTPLMWLWALLLGTWLLPSPDRPWSFPRDHYAHPEYRTEWWYVTGILRGVDSHREFGYQLTWFRIGLSPEESPVNSSWSTRYVVMAHAVIIDLLTGERAVSDVLHRAHPSVAGFGGPGDTTLAWCLGPAGADARWSFTLAADPTRRPGGVGDRFNLVATGIDGAHALALDLTAERPRLMQGDGGYSRKSETGDAASHYFSYTRLTTEGSLTWNGERVSVTGESWLDREFSSGTLDSDQVGWDWVSLRLDDGRDLTAFQLRDAGGRTQSTFGSLVETDGTVSTLNRDTLRFAAGQTWTSPTTDATYPVSWVVTVAGEPFIIDTRFPSQENVMEAAGRIAYWEGVVTARDGEGNRVGEGFLEMTGYDPSGDATLARGLR